MARGTFGERLKRERELREVSLEELTAGTRIGPRFLEALENEDWNKLPGGVFGRGFARSIAKYLGLDEENFVAEYDMARGELARPQQLTPEERIPSVPRWVPLAGSALLLLLLVGLICGGLLVWKRFKDRHRVPQSSAAALRVRVATLAPARHPAANLRRSLS